MKVLIFTHKNDIDGMGNAILANIAFDEVDYELCGTFDLTNKVESYYENDRIYEYDKVFVDYIHPFTGINMVYFYRELVKSENCEVEFVFSNDPKTNLE